MPPVAAFWACAALQGWRAALLVALGRVAHGAGAAAANVAGLALAATALPPERQQRALAALLGAVALGQRTTGHDEGLSRRCCRTSWASA